jgi:hypothetical protein
MIGGVSGGYPVLVPTDRGSDRHGDTVSAPAQAPYRPDDQAEVRRDRPQGLPAQDLARLEDPDTGDVFQQRVEARAQVQAARLERDDSSALPRQNRQALQTYGEIAGTREDSGVELVGLDLRV